MKLAKLFYEQIQTGEMEQITLNHDGYTFWLLIQPTDVRFGSYLGLHVKELTTHQTIEKCLDIYERATKLDTRELHNYLLSLLTID